eukprot:CAMPEP_0204566104 /NCGR_PEP_ID=MMETSP0661-20131031/35867_1 /ASSEMBLY_ACC=CAM_ASM_000606 /TAXON_ID=109239 /ORGANISM="Alexandrium margalefi, Strain AMGDE01CS-322" /LENGTH=62 /DNA_ID=CAMNT_0051573929 /DNA_START=45 /DNA_END=230 /DNA_ORIENTATION=+
MPSYMMAVETKPPAEKWVQARGRASTQATKHANGRKTGKAIEASEPAKTPALKGPGPCLEKY